jgi:serine phosphatase RsbU (regulator of sigma subunit)
LFTDGITEAAAGNGEEFGEERVARVSSSLSSASTFELKNQLMSEVEAFCNSQLQDDATLVVVGRNRAIG